MKIENKYEAIAYPFDEITIGECFLFRENIYMKIGAISSSDGVFNAINLKLGVLVCFSKDALVFPVMAKVVIGKD